MPTVPMLAPDGSVRMIPDEQSQAALQAGGRLVTRMSAPDGSMRWVPNDLVQNAMKAGGKMPDAVTPAATPAKPKTQAVTPQAAPQGAGGSWETNNTEPSSLSVMVGKLVPQAAVPALSAIKRFAVDPFEKLGTKGGEIGGNVATIGISEKQNPVAYGIAKGVGTVVGSTIADPRNWPFFLSGAARPILQKIISGGFGTQLAAGALSGAKQLYDDWDKMTPSQRAQTATQTGLSAAMAGASAAHLASIDTTAKVKALGTPPPRVETPTAPGVESEAKAPATLDTAQSTTSSASQFDEVDFRLGRMIDTTDRMLKILDTDHVNTVKTVEPPRASGMEADVQSPVEHGRGSVADAALPSPERSVPPPVLAEPPKVEPVETKAEPVPSAPKTPSPQVGTDGRLYPAKGQGIMPLPPETGGRLSIGQPGDRPTTLDAAVRQGMTQFGRSNFEVRQESDGTFSVRERAKAQAKPVTPPSPEQAATDLSTVQDKYNDAIKTAGRLSNRVRKGTLDASDTTLQDAQAEARMRRKVYLDKLDAYMRTASPEDAQAKLDELHARTIEPLESAEQLQNYLVRGAMHEQFKGKLGELTSPEVRKAAQEALGYNDVAYGYRRVHFTPSSAEAQADLALRMRDAQGQIMNDMIHEENPRKKAALAKLVNQPVIRVEQSVQGKPTYADGAWKLPGILPQINMANTEAYLGARDSIHGKLTPAQRAIVEQLTDKVRQADSFGNKDLKTQAQADLKAYRDGLNREALQSEIDTEHAFARARFEALERATKARGGTVSPELSDRVSKFADNPQKFKAQAAKELQEHLDRARAAVQDRKEAAAAKAAGAPKPEKDAVTAVDEALAKPEQAVKQPTASADKTPPQTETVRIPKYNAQGKQVGWIDRPQAIKDTYAKPPAQGGLASKRFPKNPQGGSQSGFVTLPFLTSPVTALTNAWKAIRRITSDRGPTVNEVAQDTFNVRLGERLRSEEQLLHQLSDYSEQWENRSIGDSLNFIHDIETNQVYQGSGPISPTATPDQILAVSLRRELDSARTAIQALGTGKLQHYIETYFPHIWTDPGKAENVIARIIAHSPLRGTGDFLKAREYDTFEEGIRRGLTPVTFNPVKLATLRIFDMQRYIMGTRYYQDNLAKGLVVEGRNTPHLPEWQKVDARIFGKEAWADPGVAKVLNAYLAPGLAKLLQFDVKGIHVPLYDIIRGANNIMNQAELSMSGFHVLGTGINASVSDMALSLQNITRVATGNGQSGRLNNLRQAVYTGARAMSLVGSPIDTFIKGNRLLAEWLEPGTHADLTRTADALMQTGYKTGIDSMYKTNQYDSMRTNWKTAWDSNSGFPTGIRVRAGAKATARAVPAALELAAKPIMEWIVPRVKLGAASNLINDVFDRIGPTAPAEVQARELNKAIDSLDNRFGQMQVDRRGWNKIARDLGYVSMRSQGWTIGTLSELGGGIMDTPKFLTRLATAQKPELSNKLAYSLALPVVVGVYGALYHFATTGQWPQKLRDYFYPGPENSKVALPTYMAEEYKYGMHPIDTLFHKVSPIVSTTAQILQNKDFWGTEIVHPDDPAYKQGVEFMKYLGLQMTPLSVTNMFQMKDRGATTQQIVGSLVGVTPAPAWVGKSPAQQKISDYMQRHWEQGPRTQAEADKFKAKRSLGLAYDAGHIDESDLMDAALNGKISARDAQNLVDTKSLGSDARSFHELHADEAYNVWKIATPEERERYRPFWIRKIDSLSKDPDPKAQELLERINNDPSAYE